jgi:hypothetical protein
MPETIEPNKNMKTLKSIALIGALAVACMELLGCAKQEADPEMVRMTNMLNCLDQQLDAATKYMDAVTKEWECQKVGDTNGVTMWRNNQVVYDRQEHEAFQRLKALAP